MSEALAKFRAFEEESAALMPLSLRASLAQYLDEIRDVLASFGLGDVPLETLELSAAHLMTFTFLHLDVRCRTGDLSRTSHAVAQDALLAAMRQWAGVLRALRVAAEVDGAGGSVEDLEALLRLETREGLGG